MSLGLPHAPITARKGKSHDRSVFRKLVASAPNLATALVACKLVRLTGGSSIGIGAWVGSDCRVLVVSFAAGVTV
jgi:hypothetical protein